MWDQEDSGGAHAGDPPWPVPSFSVNATGTRCLPLATVELPKKEGEQISGRMQLAPTPTGLSLQIWINTQRSNSQRPVPFLTRKKHSLHPDSAWEESGWSMNITAQLPLDILLPGIEGLRWSSSMLSEGEKAVPSRPSELTRIDPSLRHSLMESWQRFFYFFFCERTKQASVTAGQHTLSAGVWRLSLEGVVSLCRQLHSPTGSDKENKMLNIFT